MLVPEIPLIPLWDSVTYIIMKAIKYNRHAKRRMRDRDVIEDEVKSAIEEADFFKQSIKGRINAFKFMKGRYLRVTSKEEPKQLFIITVTIRKKPFRE